MCNRSRESWKRHSDHTSSWRQSCDAVLQYLWRRPKGAYMSKGFAGVSQAWQLAGLLEGGKGKLQEQLLERASIVLGRARSMIKKVSAMPKRYHQHTVTDILGACEDHLWCRQHTVKIAWWVFTKRKLCGSQCWSLSSRCPSIHLALGEKAKSKR